jgi:hypothetical protein
VVSNQGTVRYDADGDGTNGAGTLAAKNRAATAVDLVIDVNGYFK